MLVLPTSFPNYIPDPIRFILPLPLIVVACPSSHFCTLTKNHPTHSPLSFPLTTFLQFHISRVLQRVFHSFPFHPLFLHFFFLSSQPSPTIHATLSHNLSFEIQTTTTTTKHYMPKTTEQGGLDSTSTAKETDRKGWSQAASTETSKVPNRLSDRTPAPAASAEMSTERP